MNNSDTYTIIKDTFRKNGSEENVDGLTIIIDGKLKEVFDKIIDKSDKFDNYSNLLSAIILIGVNQIIKDL